MSMVAAHVRMQRRVAASSARSRINPVLCADRFACAARPTLVVNCPLDCCFALIAAPEIAARRALFSHDAHGSSYEYNR